MNPARTRLFSRLGYTFQDESLFETALSHRSVGPTNNERLEFLGDSLLNFFIADALYQRFPKLKEGELSRLRAILVQGTTLAEMAREFELGDHLLLGEGELKSGGFRRSSILADAVEALIGAIYTESGLDKCRNVVMTWFKSRLDDSDLTKTKKDPKTRLQEYLQERKKDLPEYAVLEINGEAHAKEFVVECRVKAFKLAHSAKASSKRKAETKAAEAAFNDLIEKQGHGH